MNRNLIYMILALLFFGCDSFLSKVPDDRTEIADVEAVKALLVSAYPEAHSLMMGETMSDNATDKGQALIAQAVQTVENFYKWNEPTTDSQDSPGYFWNACYASIAAANHALEAIAEMGDTDELQPYKGEALICRAYAHFMLVNFWAEHYDPATAANELGVPYVTKPETEALVYYNRNTIKEVYEMIENDLTTGLPLINDNAYDVAKYHFNKEAAHAFAARYYTFRGDSWDKVIEHGNAVLGAGATFIKQLRNYPEKYASLTSTPVEFAKLYTNYGEACNLLIISGSSYWSNLAGFSRYGMSSAKRKEIFETAQLRGGEWYPFIWGSAPHYMVYKYTTFFKYLYPGSNLGYYYSFDPVFTVEEVMFNRMEAYIYQKDTLRLFEDMNLFMSMRIRNYSSDKKISAQNVLDYYTLINKNWQKPEPWYVSQLDEEQIIYLQYVTDTRRKEFCQQGMRWFDIKRFYLEVLHPEYESSNVMKLTRNDLRRRMQIPFTAQNYGIEPNPR